MKYHTTILIELGFWLNDADPEPSGYYKISISMAYQNSWRYTIPLLQLLLAFGWWQGRDVWGPNGGRACLVGRQGALEEERKGKKRKNDQ